MKDGRSLLQEIIESIETNAEFDLFSFVPDLADDDFTVTIFFTYNQKDDFSKTVDLKQPNSISDIRSWICETTGNCLATLYD